MVGARLDGLVILRKSPDSVPTPAFPRVSKTQASGRPTTRSLHQEGSDGPDSLAVLPAPVAQPG